MKVIFNNLFGGTWIGMMLMANSIIKCFYNPPNPPDHRPYLISLVVVSFIITYFLVKRILKVEEK